MSEKPIERLNYFNGQRLEAEDLRLEQEFHIRIQRWLSKSLFSAGVADGLEVSMVDVDGSKLKGGKVRVSPGLALDDLGRAIVLANPIELAPQAPYLCVRYAEHKERVQEGECTVRGAISGTAARSGGPERIVSDANFIWRTAIPQHDTRELVIAELELNPDCSVARILTGPRRFAVAAQVSRVRTFALEGEKNIDQHNPKRIYFHVRGRRPDAVSLYLRAESFSTLFYTELANHKHELQLSIPPQSIGVLAHQHSLNGVTTKQDDPASVHDHLAFVARPPPVESPSQMVAFNFPIAPPFTNPTYSTVSLQAAIGLNAASVPVRRPGPDAPELPPLVERSHYHGFATSAKTGGVAEGGSTSTINLTFNQKSMLPAGLGPEQATDPDTSTTKRLRHFSNLQIAINDKPVTTAIIEQLVGADPHFWSSASRLDSGDGSPMRFGGPGAGPIRLDLLDGVTFDPGEHWIELKVQGDGNGGCVHYNLYVE